jgi:hypothetical protein
MGLMTNFLSLKEMLRISLHGKPIFGVNLEGERKKMPPSDQKTSKKVQPYWTSTGA